MTTADLDRVNEFLQRHHLQGATARKDVLLLVEAAHQEDMLRMTRLEDEVARLKMADEDLRDTNVVLHKERDQEHEMREAVEAQLRRLQ